MRARVALALASCLAAFSAGCELEEPPIVVPPGPPPALGSAPTVEPILASTPDQDVEAERWVFPDVCFNQWWNTSDPIPVTITGGAGRRVAVIGDSLTTQSRELLIGRGGFQWQVSSMCGAQISDYLPGGAYADVVDEVAAFAPDVIVVALGTNDARSRAGVRTTAPQLLAALPEGVPVAWVLPAPIHDELDFEIAVARADITNLHGVTVVDWAPWAEMPGARIDDNIHLTWTGVGVYASLLSGGTRLVDQV